MEYVTCRGSWTRLRPAAALAGGDCAMSTAVAAASVVMSRAVRERSPRAMTGTLLLFAVAVRHNGRVSINHSAARAARLLLVGLGDDADAVVGQQERDVLEGFGDGEEQIMRDGTFLISA